MIIDPWTNSSVPHVKQRIVEEIFGKGNVKDLNNYFHFWAPVFMALFYHTNICSWRFCWRWHWNVCKMNYGVLFESEKQKSKTVFTEGESWSEITLGILTDKTVDKYWFNLFRIIWAKLSNKTRCWCRENPISNSSV